MNVLMIINRSAYGLDSTSEMRIDGPERSTMEALTDATLAADKVLVF